MLDDGLDDGLDEGLGCLVPAVEAGAPEPEVDGEHPTSAASPPTRPSRSTVRRSRGSGHAVTSPAWVGTGSHRKSPGSIHSGVTATSQADSANCDEHTNLVDAVLGVA